MSKNLSLHTRPKLLADWRLRLKLWQFRVLTVTWKFLLQFPLLNRTLCCSQSDISWPWRRPNIDQRLADVFSLCLADLRGCKIFTRRLIARFQGVCVVASVWLPYDHLHNAIRRKHLSYGTRRHNPHMMNIKRPVKRNNRQYQVFPVVKTSAEAVSNGDVDARFFCRFCRQGVSLFKARVIKGRCWMGCSAEFIRVCQSACKSLLSRQGLCLGLVYFAKCSGWWLRFS